MSASNIGNISYPLCVAKAVSTRRAEKHSAFRRMKSPTKGKLIEADRVSIGFPQRDSMGRTDTHHLMLPESFVGYRYAPPNLQSSPRSNKFQSQHEQATLGNWQQELFLLVASRLVDAEACRCGFRRDAHPAVCGGL